MKLTKLEDVRAYLLAGSATFTLVSLKSGDRKTFRVRSVPGRNGAWYVDLLVGPDNVEDYKYLAFAWEDQHEAYAQDRFRALRLKPAKDRWGEDAYRAFDWLVHRLNVTRNVGEAGRAAEDELFCRQAEFWHLGKCGRCGLALTTPESIARGLGPTCAGKV